MSNFEKETRTEEACLNNANERPLLGWPVRNLRFKKLCIQETMNLLTMGKVEPT